MLGAASLGSVTAEVAVLAAVAGGVVFGLAGQAALRNRVMRSYYRRRGLSRRKTGPGHVLGNLAEAQEHLTTSGFESEMAKGLLILGAVLEGIGLVALVIWLSA